jgi:hypothetical protein
MQTTQFVAVRKDIVEDPYSDLAKVITKYALLQAMTTLHAHDYNWRVLDWAGPFDPPHGPLGDAEVVYYRAVVEQELKPGHKAPPPAELPVGRIYLPMSRSLTEAEVPGFDLTDYINKNAITAARAAWETLNPSAKGYRIVDWSGPWDYMYEQGDLPPQACCFQAYVEVTR